VALSDSSPAPATSGWRSAAILPMRAIRRHPCWAALVAALVTLLVKHPGIATRGLWIDEAWTIALGSHSAEAIVHVSTYDQNPPLYLLLMAPWLSAFGTSELALRLPSLLLSGACAALLLLFVRRFYGAEAALTATLLYVVSPAQTWYATEGRAFVLIGVLCVVSFDLYLRLLERPRRTTALLLGLVNVAAVYTHYTIAFAWVAQAVCAPLVATGATRRRALRCYVASQLLALVLFAPFVRFLVANLPTVQNSWLPPPGLADLARVAIELAGSRSALRFGLVLLACFGLWRIMRRRDDDAGSGALADRRLLVAATWAALPVVLAFVVSQKTPVLLTRYELFASLGWMVGIGAVIASLPWPPTVRLAIALVMVFLSAKATPYASSRDAGWREIAQQIQEASHDRATLAVVVPDNDCIPLAYYATPDALPSLFGPRGAYLPGRLNRRLAGQRILCRPARWDASTARLDAQRVLLIVSRPAQTDATAILHQLNARGYATVASRELAGKTIHVLELPTGAANGVTG
jgi:mannosyltransferase